MTSAERTEAVMSAYHRMIQEQLEEGLRQIQHTANALMHEIAGEVWRTAGGDKGDVQAKLLESLSRDQALRSLIAHTDERFQALAVRTARIEDGINMLSDGLRQAREHLARGVVALEDAQDSPAIRGIEDVRTQLAEVTKQIALAFETLAERDRAIVESVQIRVREHGELVVTETARISQAMEAYVQQGVAAVGQLAGNVEAQVEAIAKRDDDVTSRIEGAVQEQMGLLDERLHAISQRILEDTTSLHEAMTHLLDRTDERNHSLGEYLELMHDRVGMETRDLLSAMEQAEARQVELLHDIPAQIDERLAGVQSSTQEIAIHATQEINQVLEARIMGLAELVRSDSTTLREQLVRTAAAQNESMAQALDERLGRVSESLATSTSWMVEEIVRRIRDEAAQTIRMRLDEVVTSIERHGDEQTRLVNGRLDDAISAIDRNMIRMSDSLEGQLERMARSVGDRAAQAADLTIGERFDDVLARMHDAMNSMDRTTSGLASTQVRAESAMSAAQARTEEALAEAMDRTEETLARAVDSRVAGLAKMVRSDNETLARQIVADQEATKQALRAMKELQASLPADVVDTIQRRMDDLAESVAKSQEMLAQRIDRMASKIGERYDNDIQIVIDRMGDAMHALAGLGRNETGASADRIELE